MKTIKIEAVKTFTPEMERLRRMDYDKNTSDKIWTDEFDARSIHILATCKNELIGIIRLTINQPSVLQTWANGKAPIQNGQDIADLTRAIVAKRWRNRNIFKLLMTEAIIKAKILGLTKVFSAIKTCAAHQKTFYDLGFENIGETVVFTHPPVSRTLCQSLIQFPQEHFLKALEMRNKVLNGERLKNFKVVSEIVGKSAVV